MISQLSHWILFNGMGLTTHEIDATPDQQTTKLLQIDGWMDGWMDG